jgi:hypothetical protein
MAFGPYDYQTRNKDAEPIATRNKWIRVQRSLQSPGEKKEDACKYAVRYLPSQRAASSLIARLALLSDLELETWATVDAVAQHLQDNNQSINSVAILVFLNESDVWRDKLSRTNFEEPRINEALMHLRKLGFIANSREQQKPCR